MATLVLALSTSLTASAPGGALTPSGDSGAQRVTAPRVAGAVRCSDARAGLLWYRFHRRTYLERMGRVMPPAQRSHGCDQARSMANVARRHARSARFALRRFLSMLSDPERAIRFVFGEYAEEALAVAQCESGWSMTPRAHNGQYLGMFQMGDYARSLYGHGSSPLAQARAAYRYFMASGRDWSPWSCRP